MKTTYLVKKNPEQPTGNDNWIIMDGKEFKAFRESEEGKRRSNNFIKLCTEYDEECIVMECDLEKLKKWKAELNHAAYVQKVNQAAGFTVISYHQFDTDDEDVNGEESIKDASESIEDTVINKMETKRLVELVSQLSKEDQELIYCFYLTETPMKETVYAKKRGIPTSTLNDRKARAIARLKKLYFS